MNKHSMRVLSAVLCHPQSASQRLARAIAQILSIASLIYFVMVPTNAISATQTTTDQHRDDLSHLTFYLLTVDVGERVADNFGHTGIRMVDRRSGRDIIFNWGLYDFKDPLRFSVGFYLGDLSYKLAAYPFHYMISQYTREKRRMWQDRFDLRPEEKSILYQKLLWNNRPENRTYQYQYFFDNCSTKPRDYLDQAFGGKLGSHLKRQSTGESYRDMVRSHYQTNPFVALSLDILMNGDIDRIMTRWHKMFLPSALRRELLDFRRPDGTAVMVVDQTTLDYPPPQPLQWSGSQIFAAIIFVLSLPSLFVLSKLYRRRAFLQSALFWRLLALPTLLIYSYGGCLGILMICNHLFSGHSDLYHNANILLILPFTGLFFLQGLYWLIRGQTFKPGLRTSRLLWYYSGLQLLATTAAAISYGLGLIAQDISWELAYISPFITLTCLVNICTLTRSRTTQSR